MKITSSATYIGIWLVASTIAAILAMHSDATAFVDGQHIPVGNDSFYHARRILDAAIGERGFYQFDEMIHVPEGSWINWPWAYDYFMAWALTLAIWIRPSMEPMAFLVHVPVAWVFVNAGLLTMIGRQIQLNSVLVAVGMLGFAMLPLTQSLHRVGFIDHHYIELTFVLASLLAGLRFFSNSSKSVDAVLLGTVLGIAPAFHTGLFILQLPVLACVFTIWLRDLTLQQNNVRWLAASLIIATLLVLLPSAPFWDMQFEFWTLSWFHLYIAICSGLCLLFFGWRPYTRANIGIFGMAATVMVLPVFAKLLLGAAFLSGDLILLDKVLEVKSPIAHLVEPGGVRWAAINYSLLIFLAPLLLVLYAIRAGQKREASAIYFSIFAVLGTSLMLTQYRLHPFGSWVLLFGGLLLFEEARSRFALSDFAATTGAFVLVALAFVPPLQQQLFLQYAPGGTPDYAAARTLYPGLASKCDDKSGTVLSYSDDGHYIRFHTDCSVLTNNFLMTPLHEKKIHEANALLRMTPEQFRESAPDIDYVFVRMYGVFNHDGTGWRPVPVSDVIAQNSLLFVALTFSKNTPDGFRLIDEVRVPDDRDFALARTYEIVRDE